MWLLGASSFSQSLKLSTLGSVCLFKRTFPLSRVFTRFFIPLFLHLLNLKADLTWFVTFIYKCLMKCWKTWGFYVVTSMQWPFVNPGAFLVSFFCCCLFWDIWELFLTVSLIKFEKFLAECEFCRTWKNDTGFGKYVWCQRVRMYNFFLLNDSCEICI